MKELEDFRPWMDKKLTKIVYQGAGEQKLDLSGIVEFPQISRITTYNAKRVKLPVKHDWSNVRTLEFSWEPQWAEVLEQGSAKSILIYRPSQDALGCFNCAMPAAENGISSLSLSTIKPGAMDRWFPPAFSASWVKVVNSRTIDLSSASLFGSIGLLDFRYVTRLTGLAHFTQQGKVGAIRLDNPLILDPEEFWNIRAECINFGTDRKENDVWLEEIWEQRPADWEDKYFTNSKFMNKKLGRTRWEETWQLDQAADEKAIAYRFVENMNG